MLKILILFLLVLFTAIAPAQNKPGEAFPDSAIVRVHPKYDQVNGFHRIFFGENYRKEWAEPVKMPVIHISKVYGGLKPVREGGGMQSKSLRLVDRNGKEWVIRSVEKTPDKLIPLNFKGTFAVDWVKDAMSSQHPYSALIVPPLAAAAHVNHANPVIGVLAPDTALHEFSKVFSGLVVLLEEREPAGPSDNTLKVIRDLKENHDVRFDGDQFLRSRLLDLLLADWDRHEDQWRWADHWKNNEKVYQPVPRDRDQVFHLTEGLIPNIASLTWIDPVLDDFEGKIPRVRYSIFKTKFLKAYPDAQVSFAHYMAVVNAFMKAETDEILEAGLRRLPKEIYKMRHDELFYKLRTRRDNIPAAMAKYYRFIYKNADILTSDKNELVTISDAPGGAMRVVINKLDNTGHVDGNIIDMVYDPAITREIRLYVSGGNDQVVVNNATSPIRLRIVGGYGKKSYDVKQSAGPISVYSRKDSVQFMGSSSKLTKHLSDDTLNTRFVASNGYNLWMALTIAAINADDGLLLGAGFKYTGRDGFRKEPYTTTQQLLVTHAFATNAFSIKYNGEWLQVAGKADLLLQANIRAPDNTMNFFGQGNNTTLTKGYINGYPYRRYYRTRFDTYQVDPALRWHFGDGNTISAGPSIQLYHLGLQDNAGRIINQSSLIKSYDSLTVEKDKLHLGVLVNFTSNQRNNNVLPSKGYYFNMVLQGYGGLGNFAKSYAQIRPEFTYYQKLNRRGTIVVSDRVGGGVSLGKPAFYQSMFLGGQGNLLGFLQNRFAGQHMLYNNLQARIKLANIASYILPGQLGLSGFYDAGRVWADGENATKWHQGTGGGVYFAPAGLTVLQVLAGHSNEGWYPYVSLNFRI